VSCDTPIRVVGRMANISGMSIGREIHSQAEYAPGAVITGLLEETAHCLGNGSRVQCEIEKSIAITRRAGIDAVGTEAGGDEDVAVGLQVQSHLTGRDINQGRRGSIVECCGGRQGGWQFQTAGVGGTKRDTEQCRV